MFHANRFLAEKKLKLLRWGKGMSTVSRSRYINSLRECLRLSRKQGFSGRITDKRGEHGWNAWVANDKRYEQGKSGISLYFHEDLTPDTFEKVLICTMNRIFPGSRWVEPVGPIIDNGFSVCEVLFKSLLIHSNT
jgi:hypothetical protein